MAHCAARYCAEGLHFSAFFCKLFRNIWRRSSYVHGAEGKRRLGLSQLFFFNLPIILLYISCDTSLLFFYFQPIIFQNPPFQAFVSVFLHSGLLATMRFCVRSDNLGAFSAYKRLWAFTAQVAPSPSDSLTESWYHQHVELCACVRARRIHRLFRNNLHCLFVKYLA